MQENLPHLTPRLSLIASFVRLGVPLADIGTDHAYLPVYLVNTGANPTALACDIREGPLARARLTARAFGAGEKVTFRLTDGLVGVEPSQADDIIIAGMGGELIGSIIARCPWLKDPRKHLVLQPMTAQEQLRQFLCENGFAIEREAVATERGARKLYLVQSVCYTGQVRQADALYCYTGELPRANGKNARAYLHAKAGVLYKKADGLARSKTDEGQEARAARTLADRISEIAENIED